MLQFWRKSGGLWAIGLSAALSLPAIAAGTCPEYYRRLPEPPLALQQKEYTCGAACVVSLLGQLKRTKLSEAHVAAVMGTNRAIGTTPEKMAKGLRLFGIHASVREKLSLRALKENFRRHRGQILLVHEGTAHWVVLADYKGGKIRLMDPWKENRGYRTLSEEELAKIWSTTLFGKKAEQLAIVTR